MFKAGKFKTECLSSHAPLDISTVQDPNKQVSFHNGCADFPVWFEADDWSSWGALKTRKLVSVKNRADEILSADQSSMYL
jgi:hypothetical protein